MIRPEQIPAAAVRVASRAASDLLSDDGIRSTIAAAINAWPKAYLSPDHIDPQQIRLTLEKADG